MKIALIGAGGFAREVQAQLRDAKVTCPIQTFVDRQFLDPDSRPLEDFDPAEYVALVAVASPKGRDSLVQRLPDETRYYSFVHPDAKILGRDVAIGEGSIVCPGCIITTNVTIGRHAHLNIGTTIGHDFRSGDFFTTAPGARISGNCTFGHRVYVGTSAAVREKLSVCSDVTIGLLTGVVSDITEPGVYVGSPAKRLSK
jgi:sugar O-acyltransferase (sialic acid O-acetyltransferase NeuD family)